MRLLDFGYYLPIVLERQDVLKTVTVELVIMLIAC